jgi:hypothetical protein
MNSTNPWIDPRVQQVRAANLHAYLLRRGWKLKPSRRPQVLLFEEPPGPGGKRIVQSVPAKDGGSGYLDCIVRVITNLAALEDRLAVEVLNDILEQPAVDLVSANGPVLDPAPARARRRKEPLLKGKRRLES